LINIQWVHQVKSLIKTLSAVSLALAALLPSIASAQVNTAPIQFDQSFGGGSGSLMLHGQINGYDKNQDGYVSTFEADSISFSYDGMFENGMTGGLVQLMGDVTILRSGPVMGFNEFYSMNGGGFSHFDFGFYDINLNVNEINNPAYSFANFSFGMMGPGAIFDYRFNDLRIFGSSMDTGESLDLTAFANGPMKFSQQTLLPSIPSITGAVPEPETYGMMLAGLGVLSALARRRKPQQGALRD
jgi:hypothetical protein